MKICHVCGIKFIPSRTTMVTCSKACVYAGRKKAKFQRHKRNCKYCNVEFSKHKDSKYCSKKCALDVVRRKCINIICPICNKSFTRLGDVGKFTCCSNKCRGAFIKKSGRYNGVKNISYKHGCSSTVEFRQVCNMFRPKGVRIKEVPAAMVVGLVDCISKINQIREMSYERKNNS